MAMRVRVVRALEWTNKIKTGDEGSLMCMVRVRPFIVEGGRSYDFQYKVQMDHDQSIHGVYHFDPNEITIHNVADEVENEREGDQASA